MTTTEQVSERCTWCYGSGEWVEQREVVPCEKCNGTGRMKIATTNAGSVRPGDVIFDHAWNRDVLVLAVDGNGTCVALAIAPVGLPVLATNVGARVLSVVAVVELVR